MKTAERECVAQCGRPTALFLCKPCAGQLERDLGDVPALLAELDITVARQHQFDGRSAAGHERPLVFGWHAADVLWSLSNVVGTWARSLAEDRGIVLDLRSQRVGAAPRHARHDQVATVRTVVEFVDAIDEHGAPTRERRTREERLFHDDPAIVQGVQRIDATTFGALAARWLLRHVDAVRMSPAADALVDEVRDAVRMARKAIDRAPVLMAVGQCGAERQDEAVDGSLVLLSCQEVLYLTGDQAERGERTATCPACGAEHDVAERREWMLAEAHDQLVTGTVALSWVALLLGKQIPRGTWDSWTGRARILPHGLTVNGHPTYRFGEVQQLAMEYVSRPRKNARRTA